MISFWNSTQRETEISKKKSEFIYEKPFLEINWQQWKFPSKMWFLIYAYDTNCLYWIENKLFLFIFIVPFTVQYVKTRNYVYTTKSSTQVIVFF